MILIADTHVHIYPNYSLEFFFKECFRKILKIKQNLKASVVSCICLTEIDGCNYYLKLTNNYLGSDFAVKEYDNFKVIDFKGESLFIFPGFQTNTKEKIEVLELFTTERVGAGQNLKQTISLIAKKNALPVVSWSFGKWLGKRGEFIKEIIEKEECKFALGDSALRFIFHPLPKLFKIGRRRDLTIVCGSDPLPINGEESMVFEYYSSFDNFEVQKDDIKAVGEAIKEVIINKNLKPSGRRNSFFIFLSRWLRVMFGKS